VTCPQADDNPLHINDLPTKLDKIHWRVMSIMLNRHDAAGHKIDPLLVRAYSRRCVITHLFAPQRHDTHPQLSDL